MTPEILKNKRVLVVGAGVTGQSVMRYLKAHTVAFDVADSKDQPSSVAIELLGEGRYISPLSAVPVDEFDVMVLSPGIPRSHSMLQQALAAGVEVVGDVELFAVMVKGPVIAVTGSNGKSTVASMAAHVLTGAGRNAALCGNIGTAVLDVLPQPAPAAKTTKEEPHLANPPIYVLELSSYQLESLHSLMPISAVVLNISDDHLDRYDSIEHYAAVKRTIYAQASCCVANLDDARTHPESTNSRTQWFSLQDPNADYAVQQLENGIGLFAQQQCVVMADELSVPGQHNVANALAVMALLQPVQLSLAELKQGLTTFKGLAHRTEFVAELDGVRWFNDSKGTNVDACMKAVEAMPGPVVLIAGGQGKGADFSTLRDVVTRRVKAVLLLGEDGPLLRAALSGTTQLFDVTTLPEAVRLAKDLAVPGDAVLLSPACASFDMFDNYMARGDVFRDSVERLAA